MPLPAGFKQAHPDCKANGTFYDFAMKKNKAANRENIMKKTITSLAFIACLGMGVATFTTGCSGDRYHRSTGTYVDDKAIGAKVKTELLGDSEVKGLAVNVEVNNGRVQLSGFVDSLAQKNRAAELARNVPGVKYVKNDLVVK